MSTPSNGVGGSLRATTGSRPTTSRSQSLLQWRARMTQSLRRERAFPERQAEALPNIDQGFGERVDQTVVMIGARRDAQPLETFRHGRIIERLDVDAMFGKKQIARRLAVLGIADEDRNNVGRTRHHRQRSSSKHRLDSRGAVLMTVALPLRGFQMADRRGRSRTD